MNRIRIGKDFNVRWSLYDKDGKPYELSTAKTLLRVISPYGKTIAENTKIQGNVIEWIFRGKDQKYLGKYTLELVEKYEENGMITVDTVGAFELVAHSYQESLNKEGFVIVQTVDIVGELVTGIDLIDQFLDFEIDDDMCVNLTYLSSNGGLNLDFQITEDGYLTVDNLE